MWSKRFCLLATGTVLTSFLASEITPAQVIGGPRPRPSDLFIQQVGAATAYVPMRHGSCGENCGEHELARNYGNLNFRYHIKASCRGWDTISYLWLSGPGGNDLYLLTAGEDANPQKFDKVVNFKTFTMEEIEKACFDALGGRWLLEDGHENTTRTVKKTLTRTQRVNLKCSDGSTFQKSWPTTLTLTCEDLDF